MNHRIFERTLRSLVFRGACPFECREVINPLQIFVLKGRLGVEGLSAASSTPSKVLGTANRILDGLLSGVIVNIYVARADLEGAGRGLVKALPAHSFYLTSNRVGLPAELKHINKRRKRN